MIPRTFQRSTATADADKRLPLDMQIRIDIDRYDNGDLCCLSVHNTLACDMSEYRKAIRFLEDLPVYQKVSPEVIQYLRGLRKGLHYIESWREDNDGKPYTGGVPFA